MGLQLKNNPDDNIGDNTEKEPRQYNQPNDEDDLYAYEEISFAKPDENPPQDDLQYEEGGLTGIFIKLLSVSFFCSLMVGMLSGMFWVIGIFMDDSNQSKLSGYEVSVVTVTEVKPIRMESKVSASRRKNSSDMEITWYQPLVVQTKYTQHKYSTYYVDAKIKEELDTVPDVRFSKATPEKYGYSVNDATPKYKVGDCFEVYVPRADVKTPNDTQGYVKADVDKRIDTENDVNGFMKKVFFACVVIFVLTMIAVKVLDKLE